MRASPVSILRDYQREAIDDTVARWEAGATCVPIVMATGLGKGHPLGTDVPTPDGWRKWGDLRVGDQVFGRQGAPVRVTGVYDRGTLPAYRVTLSDGASVVVDGDHLWTVRDSGDSRRPWVTATTAEIARCRLKRPRGWRFHIPMTGQVQYTGSTPALPLDPYTVGALISNGSMTGGGTQLTTPDAHVAERVAQAVSIRRVADSTPGVCPRYLLSGLVPVTRALGMRVRSKDKRVPPAFLAAGVGDRIALLHGLMDGDGAKRDRSRRSVSYFTSSRGLADDVSELVSSLGGTGIVKTYDRGAKGVEYAVRILLPGAVPAFSQGRKSDNGVDSVRNLQPKRAIVSIEPVGDRPIRCISVDAEDRLYLITRQYIVTHNTFTFNSLISEWLDANPGKRALVIAHTNELIEQAAKNARQVMPRRRVGIVKGPLNNAMAEVVVSSRQTLASEKRRNQIRNVGLIVIDECHHAVAGNTYGKILQHFGALEDCDHAGMIEGSGCWDCQNTGYSQGEPQVKVLGVTATLARSDKAKLSTVWEDCTFKRDILFGIKRGYLLDVKGERVVVDDLDMRNVATRGGDYSESAIADELERTFAIETIAKEYARVASDRKGIAFWPLVATAEHAARVFTEAGIPSAVVHGQMPAPERRKVLADLRSGAIQVVHNAMVLTEGFDDPTIECVVIGRPTKSAPLYIQMVGRALRPDLTKRPSDRRAALVIDVTGASDGNDLRSLIDLSPERPLGQAYGEHPDATLSELEDFLAEQIASEIDEQRAGASWDFESDEFSGPVTTRAFDPLGRAKVWGQTSGGTYYVKSSVHAKGDSFTFLVDSREGDPGTFDIVQCSEDLAFIPNLGATPRWARATEHMGLHLDMALAFGEELAGDAFNARQSAWRKRAPGNGMIGKARSLGITPDGMNAGELSDAISNALASRTIDTIVARVRAAMQ